MRIQTRHSHSRYTQYQEEQTSLINRLRLLSDCYSDHPCQDYRRCHGGTTTTTSASDCRKENSTYSIRFCLTSAAAMDFHDFDLDSEGMWTKVSDNFVQKVFICWSNGCNNVRRTRADILLISVILSFPVFLVH